MEKNKVYTISVYAENSLGIMNRLTSIFLKRRINLEHISASQSEIKDVFCFVLVVKINEERLRKLVGQIEKQIDVIKTYYYTEDEILCQELALFKIASNLLFDDSEIQSIIKKSNVNIISVSKDYFVIEKVGSTEEIDQLFDDLIPYKILQFVRTEKVLFAKEAMHNPGSITLKEFNY